MQDTKDINPLMENKESNSSEEKENSLDIELKSSSKLAPEELSFTSEEKDDDDIGAKILRSSLQFSDDDSFFERFRTTLVRLWPMDKKKYKNGLTTVTLVFQEISNMQSKSNFNLSKRSLSKHAPTPKNRFRKPNQAFKEPISPKKGSRHTSHF